MWTYSHSGAVFANASVQNDVKIVVAGVEGPAADADDGEDEHLYSDDGQLRKKGEGEIKAKGTSHSPRSERAGAHVEAAGVRSGVGGRSK